MSISSSFVGKFAPQPACCARTKAPSTFITIRSPLDGVGNSGEDDANAGIGPLLADEEVWSSSCHLPKAQFAAGSARVRNDNFDIAPEVTQYFDEPVCGKSRTPPVGDPRKLGLLELD